MSALFNQLQRLIKAGRTAGIAEKMSMMLGYDMLTINEYDTLMKELQAAK